MKDDAGLPCTAPARRVLARPIENDIDSDYRYGVQYYYCTTQYPIPNTYHVLVIDEDVV